MKKQTILFALGIILISFAASGSLVCQDLSNKPLKRAVDYWKRAKAKEDAKNIDGALQDIQIALGMNYGRAGIGLDVWNVSSRLKEKKGDLKGALADLDNCISIYGSVPGAYEQRAEFKARNGDIVGAEKDFEQDIAATQQIDWDVTLKDPIIEKYRKRIAELRADPRHPNTLLGSAIKKSEAGDYAGAIEDLNRANTYTPNDSRILLTRAFQYLFLNQPDKAKLDLDAALNAKDR